MKLSESITRLAIEILLFLLFGWQFASPQTWRDLLKTADSLSQAGNQDSAILIGKLSLEKAQTQYGQQDTAVATVIERIGQICYSKADYNSAESLFRQALAIRKIKQDPLGLEMVRGLNWLSNALTELGEYTEAESLYQIALLASKKAFGWHHPEVARNLNALGVIFRQLGRYTEAETLHQQALIILEGVYGKESQQVTKPLNNLGILYSEQGKFAQAELLFKRVLAIREKTLGPVHPDVGRSLDLLASTYADQGKMSLPEPLFKRALEIAKVTLGPHHPSVGTKLYNLGSFYAKQGRCPQAESAFQSALEIYTNSLGSGHPYTARILLGLATVQDKRGNHLQAGVNIQSAWEILKEQLGPQHPYFAESQEVLARHYHAMDSLREALNISKIAFEIRAQNFEVGASVMSEKDALTFSNFVHRAANLHLSCFVNAPDRAIYEEEVAEMVFKVKGVVSDAIYERYRGINYQSDPNIHKLWKEFQSATQQMSSLFVKGMGTAIPRSLRWQLDSLNNLVHDLESRLARASSSFETNLENKKITVEKLASLIPAEAVMIEYMKYDRFQSQKDSASPHYLTVILNQKARVEIIDLGEALPIDLLIEQYRLHLAKVSSQSYLPTSKQTESYKKIAGQLFKKIWLPLEKFTSPAELILICPDGGLNLISFAGLVDRAGSYLIERHKIHYLSSGRDLIQLQHVQKENQGLIAFGDPDYEVDAPWRKPLLYKPLEETKTEVERIAQFWHENTGEPAEVYWGITASETNFKSKASAHKAIHLATHGFYLSDASKSSPSERGSDLTRITFQVENPLLLSGLLLSKGPSGGRSGADDGVLTAEEVTCLNLEGTALVVLSACETGLGRVTEGEGVYGLRRAFQMAGARTIISALWRIPDRPAAETMQLLYSIKGSSIASRLHQTQLAQLETLRKNKDPDHPYSWASFIAIGDW